MVDYQTDPRLVLSNVLYDSLNENEYGFVIGLSTSASATLKLGLKADNRSMYATKWPILC